MNQKYVILTSEQPAVSARRMGPRAGAAALPAVKANVEVDELDATTAAAVAQKASTVAIAPVMPMKLIEPVATNVVAVPAAGMAWGIQAVKADQSPLTGAGITVAVLDTGIDATHPAFAGVTLVQRNFTNEAATDLHGHGTHCAGTIFGRDVGGTRIGVARGVTKAVIGKVLGAGGGSSDEIVQAIQWAMTEGANVISMSLGMDFPGYVAELQAQGLPTQAAVSIGLEGYRANVLLFERVASLIAAQGMFMQPTVVIAAAGNESERAGVPAYEISVSPPAVSDGIISVAALGTSAPGFVVAPFSNTGALVSGPGVAVNSAKMGGGLTAMSGTSMATPHVAGVAALWAERLVQTGQFTRDLLEGRLIGNATVAGMAPGFDPSDIGGGMVQAPL